VGSLMATIIDTGRYPTKYFRPEWQPGESAWLCWNGYPQVPRYMSDWGVTVLRCSRNTPDSVPLYRVRIARDGSERTVRAEQLEVPHE
jgi:hypothetical protein